jgi:Tol biopolymer transport system component/serine/threonine protein kinase/tetratricopeptide (TPR) repeat protein
MPDESWGKIEELFQQAIDLPREERAAYLAAACGGDAGLQQQVEELIAAYDEAGDFIEAPALLEHSMLGTGRATATQSATQDVAAESLIGRRIGAYRVVRQIGRGGMGAVFLAQRADDAFQKRVAIKLIKRGMDTEFVLRRFRNERQILATLDHPNIAHLLDGGTTDDGLPYFVMEYIEGQPINLYCDSHRLPLRERLRLFQQVCAAVHYAHQHLILHRDIKPGNILVTADGAPKLLDFGIAKLLNPELALETIEQTATAMRLMTPEYASPEQARGEKLTPASDIYSLGVLLYELLTGHRPYRFTGRAPHEIARVICDEEPEDPATIISRGETVSGGAGKADTPITLETICRNRSTTPDTLRRELSGPLNDITLKALRKEPERRYPSAEMFAADIQRYLDGLPVSAASFSFGPDSKDADTGDSGTRSLAVLPFKILHVAGEDSADTGDRFLGIGLADALITRLSNIRRIAVRPTSSVLKYAADTDPIAIGRMLNANYVLDGHIQKAGDRIRITVQLVSVRGGAPLWAAQFDEKLTDMLSLQDSLSSQVAGALIPQLTGEEQERLIKHGTDDPRAHEAYLRGRYHWHTYTEEGLAKAIVYFHEAIALDRNYAQAYSGVADYHNWLGLYGVLPPAECFAAAKAAARRAIEIDDSLGEAYASLAFAVWAYDWNAVEAERLFKQAIKLNPNYAQAHEWYSHLHGARGRHEEAIREMRRAQKLDPRSPTIAAIFAFCLHNARRYEEGLAQLRRALDMEPDHPIALQGLGWVLPPLGRHDEAIAACRRAVDLSGRAPVTLLTLGHVLAVAGRQDEARAIIRELEVLAKRRYVPPYYFALIHAGLGEPDAAFAWLERAIAGRDIWLVWLPVEPRFDPLRGDPRFAQCVSRLRPLPDSQAAVRLRAEPAPETGWPGRRAVPEKDTAPFKETEGTPAGEMAGEASQAAGDAVAAPFSRRVAAAVAVALLVGALAVMVVKWRARPGGAAIQATRVYPVRLTSHPGDDRYPRVSPDGSQIAFSSNRDGKAEIYVMNADGSGGPRRLTFNQVEDTAPSWSPDGRKILFDRVTAPGEESDVYVMDADGSNQLNLTNAPGYDTRGAWSPDGRKIAFASNRGGSFDIYVMNADGTGLQRLTDDPEFENDPSWSPDGKALAFTRATRDGSFEIFVMNADGTQQVNLTKNPAHDSAPVWSPDGQKIAFSSSRPYDNDNRHDIYVMNADGRDVRRVTRNPAHDTEATWLPDSRHLVFHSNRDGNFELYLTDIESNQEIDESKDTGRGAPQNSILVLPFKTESASATDASLGVGLADALTSKLGQIKQLTVRPAAAGRRYMNDAQDVPQIGRELGVNYVLRGTLRSAGGSVRVAAELVSAGDGRIMWAEKFDQQFKDFPTLQNDISERVTRSLMLELTASERRQLARRPTENSEAYQLYLVGRYYFGKRGPDDLRQAISVFEQALRKDPNFALAYSGVADAYALLELYLVPPPRGALEKARENALKAVALDDQLAEAHASLGYVKFYFDRDRAGGEQEFRRAIDLNPSYATAHHWLAMALAAMGRHDEAITEIKIAQQLDPRAPIIYSAAGMVYLYARQYDQALDECRKGLELDAGLGPAYRVMREVYQAMGRYDEAYAAHQKDLSFSGGQPSKWPAILAQINAVGGRREAARAALQQALAAPAERRETGFMTYEIAVAYALLDDRDQALAWLAKAEAIKGHGAHGFAFAMVDPRLDSVRSDPRFAELWKKAGLSM